MLQKVLLLLLLLLNEFIDYVLHAVHEKTMTAILENYKKHILHFTYAYNSRLRGQHYSV